ncbi:MAG: DNA-binding response regulator [Gammaproteobacteria bacterium]|nr:MAG: DNA-binding response regulator [Gammaproteobacteria bacterium]
MKILIAEDDLHIRQGLADMLNAEGYSVITAENGEAALQSYQHANPVPDFIILDVMMPKMDGFSVCKAIRRENNDIPILFLTAKTEEIDKVLGLELGADDYISKPFSVAELRARIKTIARRCLKKQSPDADHFLFGELLVFPDELRAIRKNHDAEQVIELSFREVKLLTCLHQHAGQVVSRDMLFDAAWGYEHLPNSRTLDQHISKLRKHIELDPAKPTLIQTVHGQGYRYMG